MSVDYFTSPDPSLSRLTLFVLVSTNASRIINVTLWSPVAHIVRATGSTIWLNGATSARILPIDITLQEGFAPLESDLEWIVMSSSTDGEALLNVTSATTAANTVNTYYDSISFWPLTDGTLYDDAVLDLTEADMNAGHATVAVPLIYSTAGSRCVQLLVATLTITNSTSQTLLTMQSVYANYSFNAEGPHSAVNLTSVLTLSLIGVNGDGVVTSLMPNLYLLGLVYNCSLVSLSPLLEGLTSVSRLLADGSLTLLPLLISEAVDDVDVTELQGASLSAYNDTATVSIAASAASPVDLFVALMMLVGTDPAVQVGSGYINIAVRQQMTAYTIQLTFQQHPTALDASFYFNVALLAAGSGASATWPSASASVRLSLTNVTASVYVVQDNIIAAPLSSILQPADDSPVASVMLSTTIARQLLVLLVDTSHWSSSMHSQCSSSGTISGATLSSDTATSVPVSLALADGSTTLIYGYSLSNVPAKSPLQPFNSSLSLVAVLPRLYESLAWLAVLSDSDDLTSPATSCYCRLAASLNTHPPANSIDGSLLPRLVPYLPLDGHGSSTSVVLPVSFIIGTAEPALCAIELRNAYSSAPLGSQLLSVPFARHPTLYNTTVTLTTLPLVDHTELYWHFTLTVFSNSSSQVFTSTKPVAAAASTDAIDLSALPSTVNLTSATSVSLDDSGPPHSLAPVTLTLPLTASTAGYRWLSARLLNSTAASADLLDASDIFGVYSTLVVGGTGNRSYIIDLPLTQPVAVGSVLTLQVFLTLLQTSSAATNNITAWQTTNILFIGAVPTPPVDSLDLTLAGQTTRFDCNATFYTVELNISTQSARSLVVQLQDFTANTATSASVSIPTATFVQPHRVLVPIDSATACGHIFSIEVALYPASGSNAVLTTSLSSTLLGTQLGSTVDAVQLNWLSPSTLQWWAGVTITTRMAPRVLYANLVNEDGSFSYGNMLASSWLWPGAMLAMQWEVFGATTSALLGGSNTRCSLILTSTLIPSLATSTTAPWQVTTFQSVGGSTGTFGWRETESGDALCDYQHTGLVTFNTTLQQYIDLNAADGSSSSGKSIPGDIGGAGSGSIDTGTAGFTFEFTFRSGPETGNGKLCMIGNGGGVSDIWVGSDGGGNGFQLGLIDATGAQEELYPFSPTVVGQWYHFVMVLQQISPGSELVALFVYVNGQLLTWNTGITQSNFLNAGPRMYSYLGRSDWGDPYWSGELDTFRIYDQALSASQVSSLYAHEMGGCPINVSSIALPPSSSAPNTVPNQVTALVQPWYSLTFDTDPRLINNATGYGWYEVSPTDNATYRAVHTGLLSLNASIGQFLNLTAADGDFSVGQPLPQWGGGATGWAFEVSFKPTIDSTAQTWSKVANVGEIRPGNAQGTCIDDLVIGYFSNSDQWQACICDAYGHAFQTNDGFGNIYGQQWYHLVFVVGAPSRSGLSNYFMYVNGRYYTTISNVLYPPLAPRRDAFIGRSLWGDSNFTGEVDSFNIYNQSLSSDQVAQLYMTAFGDTAIPTATLTPSPSAPAARDPLPTGVYWSSTEGLPDFSATPFYTSTVCLPAPSCPAQSAVVPAAWYNLTFDESPALYNAQLAWFGGDFNTTLTDALYPSSLPSNVDPRLAVSPFNLTINASCNGQRSLRMVLYTNNTGEPLVYASGAASITGPIQQQLVTVTLQPLIPISYGMHSLLLSCALLPLDIFGGPSSLNSDYQHFSLPPSVMSALSTASIGSSDTLSIALANSSTTVDPRTLSIDVRVDGSISMARNINCSVNSVDVTQLTLFSFGSAAYSFQTATILHNYTMSVPLPHLLYPGLNRVQVVCYITMLGGSVDNAVAFSNTIAIRVANSSAITITLNGPKHTTANVQTSLAYASGTRPVPFQPTIVTLGTGPQSLMMWVPKQWAAVTNPPASGINTADPSTALSHYISPLASLMEAAEVWAIQQRSNCFADDAVTLTIQCIDDQLLMQTPLCTSPFDTGNNVVVGLSSASNAASLINCPDLVVVNNDELAARIERDELIILDGYLSKVASTTGQVLTDELSRYYLNALQIGAHLYAIPVTSDTRLLFFNKTTLGQLALAQPPPFDPLRWGGSSGYARSWTWTAFGDYLQAITAAHGNGSGAVMYGGHYEELILAQIIAQSSNAVLLEYQPTSSTYSTTPGQGSGLQTTQYQLAVKQTFDRWLHVDSSVTADTLIDDAYYQSWLAAPMADSSSITLTGTPTLFEQAQQLVSSLYIQALLNGSGWDAALVAAADIATVMPRFTGFAIESSLLTAFIPPTSEIGYAMVPGAASYLGGRSVVITTQSLFADAAFNLSFLLVDETQPYVITLSTAMHTVPPLSSLWSSAPFDSADYALQQTVISQAKPISYPLSPLSQLPALIANDPLRHLVGDLAYRQVSADAALTSASLAVSTAFFPVVQLTHVGDTVQQSQSAVYVIIGCVVAVLSSWVASIVCEQVIYNHHHKDYASAAAWLLLVAFAACGGGIWCGLLMQASGMQVNANPTPSNTTLPVTFAMDLALAILPLAILPAYMGLLCMLGSLEKARRAVAVVTVAARQQAREEGQEFSSTSLSKSTSTRVASSADPTTLTKKRRAAGATLDWLKLLGMLYAAFDWRCVVAGGSVALSLVSTRILVFQTWVVAADITPSTAATILCFVLDWLLCTVSVMFMFHAIRSRVVGVFIFAIAVVLDYQINFYTMSLTYTGMQTSTLIHSFTVSSATLSVVTGVIAAFVCLLFVGLQFQRMKLSRYALAQQVAKLHAAIEKEKAKVQNSELQARLAQMERDVLAKMMELMTLCRPIGGEPAFLLAFAATASNSKMVRTLLDPVSLESQADALIPNKDAAAKLSLKTIREEIARTSLRDEVEEASADRRESQNLADDNGDSTLASKDDDNPARAISPSAEQSILGAGKRLAWSISRPSVDGHHTYDERFERTVLTWMAALSSAQSMHGPSKAKLMLERVQSYDDSDAFPRPSPFVEAIARHAASQALVEQDGNVANSAEESQKLVDLRRSITNSLTTRSFSLDVLLQHPVCIEIIKDELGAIHSVENLSFWLAADRYGELRPGELARYIAHWIHRTFVAAGSPQQININTNQRVAIETSMKKGHYDINLFRAAKREVLSLMETNLKNFRGGSGYRICCWVLEATLLSKLQLQAASASVSRSGNESDLLQQNESDILHPSSGGMDVEKSLSDSRHFSIVDTTMSEPGAIGEQSTRQASQKMT